MTRAAFFLAAGLLCGAAVVAEQRDPLLVSCAVRGPRPDLWYPTPEIARGVVQEACVRISCWDAWFEPVCRWRVRRRLARELREDAVFLALAPIIGRPAGPALRGLVRTLPARVPR